MNEDELFLCSHKLLISVHTMTGWTLPEGDFLDCLENNFEKKLTESYSNLNMQEFEYAFRNRDAAVKDWGKSLNFSLIDEVLLPYLASRFELSKLEEQDQNKTKMLLNEKNTEPIDMIEWINEWQKKDNIHVDLIPMAFYEFLTDTGELVVSKEDKFASIERAAKAIKTELHDDVPSCKTMDALRAVNEFKAMEEKGFTGKFKERILNKAKKLIVYDYLTKK